MIGTMVAGRYQVIEEIALDEVLGTYRAKDVATGKDVCLRSVMPEFAVDQSFIDALRETVGSGQAVSHPGVERVSMQTDGAGGVYLVSDFFSGLSLEGRLRRLATLSVPLTVTIAVEVAEALNALHAAGLAHGDVGLRTVLSNQSEQIRLVMPGFWRAYGANPRAAVAMLRQMAPSLAPEVTAGAMPSPTSDVYALGVLMWQILAGRPPFAGDTPGSVAVKHATAPYPSLREVNAAVPTAMDEIIRKAMSRNPLERYPSANALLADLKQVQDALRFGRPLTWPLTPPSQVPDEPAVAPTMNALDAKPRDPQGGKKKTRERGDRDDRVPRFLTWLAFLTTIAAVVVLGMWFAFWAQQTPMVQVPNMVGKPLEAAREEAKKLKFTLREIGREQNDKFAANTIIQMNPSPGESVRENSYVDVTVSAGSRIVEVPDFRGRSLDEAKQLAQSMGLRLQDADIEFVMDREAEPNTIVGQLPERGQKVERLTRLRLKVSGGTRRDEAGPRGARRTYTVTFDVPDTLTSAVTVRIEMTDERGTRTIFEERQEPGTNISQEVRAFGDNVLFRIFFDDEFITQRQMTPEDANEAPESGGQE